MQKELGNPRDSLTIKIHSKGFCLDGSSLWEQREIFWDNSCRKFPGKFASETTACRKIKKMISPLISELEKATAEKHNLEIVWQLKY